MNYKFNDKIPNIDESAFVANSSDLIGDVEVLEEASVWFGAVLRADENKIIVGERVNVQDNSTVHTSRKHPTEIGENTSIGHNCVIHACKVGKNCLIGMGSVILDGAEIGDNTIIGAGSLVTGGKKIPSGVLCVGSPARVVRELTEKDVEYISSNCKTYVDISKEYKK
ncbi:gamma carbonic anhydrase family protein [Clostridium sp. MB40-C1]|uniref:gamma carbonic anhydrase family protein n=1 Tax=Clostridium sp. MB40-C1 TaxID=3070996 RepID=UPI0027DF34DF|nr:gamma carbonic anhydrase family protein [Clostridium sp. MB40-C1]WMJ82369.1 gamma carbonic anhydrase family protein [Clostridium sp. MB40-C1]